MSRPEHIFWAFVHAIGGLASAWAALYDFNHTDERWLAINITLIFANALLLGGHMMRIITLTRQLTLSDHG